MTDISSTQISILGAQHLAGMPRGAAYQYPNYNGNSILNIPSSICQWLGAPPMGAPRLQDAIHAHFDGGVQRVLFILMDGLALHRLQRWMQDGTAPVWKSLLQDGLLTPLTSVVPSTTSAAVTSLWTGVSPQAHGIVGYELWLKEFGIVTNMILYAPISYARSGNGDGGLTRAGFKPREFLNQPTLGAHLAAHGIPTCAFQHYSIASSGLSQMFLNQVRMFHFNTAAEMCINLREWLETPEPQRSLGYVYWSEMDHLAHLYGPDDERAAAEFALFSRSFEELVLNNLSPRARQGTLLLLAADHGQITTAPAPDCDVSIYPDLNASLHIKPTGENRLVYLHVRPEKEEQVRTQIADIWGDRFTVVSSEDVIASHLLGPEEPHPDLLSRLGDLVLIPGEKHYLRWQEKTGAMVGRHGGLHPEEMLVPLLAVRL